MNKVEPLSRVRDHGAGAGGLRPRAGAWLVLSLCLAACAFGQTSLPQQRLPDASQSQIQTYETKGSILMVRVLTENQGKKIKLDRQAVVKLRNESTKDVMWQTTTDVAEASFGDLTPAIYNLEVSAVGYLTAQKQVVVQSELSTYHSEITLERDPGAVELSVQTTAQMPKKVAKETQRGVAALKSGNYKEAEKRLNAAYAISPESSELNFLLGYLSIQQKRPDLAQNFLHRAATLDPRNVRALTLLGKLHLQAGEYGAARASLEQAVAANPADWMAHNLLGETYLRQQEFQKSLEQAQLAVDENRAKANPAELVLGQALAHLNRIPEAIQVLKTYLQEMPTSPMTSQVHSLIAQLEAPAPAGIEKSESRPRLGITLSAEASDDDATGSSGQGWQPPGIDDARPVVAAGVTCPADLVIENAGKRVQQLVNDVARFSAIEDLLHERLDPLGAPVSKETRKFNYVVAISEAQPGFLEVDEYRSERSGQAEAPDEITSRGFMALALVFHPDMRDNFQMSCEGLGQWKGQATWLVHFGQRADRPNRIHSYRIGGQWFPVDLKGRAWITADKFQIVRMESEMVAPMPKIQLLTEHQIVEYGPILFQKKNEELWLPKSAEFYLNFRHRRYFRRHSFDHFMLFSVDADEKRKEPPGAVSNLTPKACDQK